MFLGLFLSLTDGSFSCDLSLEITLWCLSLLRVLSLDLSSSDCHRQLRRLVSKGMWPCHNSSPCSLGIRCLAFADVTWTSTVPASVQLSNIPSVECLELHEAPNIDIQAWCLWDAIIRCRGNGQSFSGQKDVTHIWIWLHVTSWNQMGSNLKHGHTFSCLGYLTWP